MNRKSFPFLRIGIITIISLVGLWLIISAILFAASPGLIFMVERSYNIQPEGVYEQGIYKLANGTGIDFVYVNNLQSQKVILYLHGNSGRLPHLFPQLSQNYDVFAPANPGFHNSEGSPTTESIFETGEKAYQYLLDRGYTENNIIIWGHSLGGPNAVHLASVRPNARALVLVNAVSSVQRICQRQYSIFCVFSGGIMNGMEEAKRINPEMKVYHYHLKTDISVPFDEGVALHDAINSQNKKFVEMSEGTHSLVRVSQTLEWDIESQNK